MRDQPGRAHRTTRRTTRLLAALFSLLMVASLVACGDSDDDAGGADTTTPTNEAPTDEESGTVTIEHRYGSTPVAVAPERIVSLDAQWTDVLLALDAPPVGYIKDPGAPDGFPWRGDGLADSTGMTATDALPYEQIAALHPDLIVVAYFAQSQEDYDRLSAIAPTIATLSPNQVDSWQDTTTAAGKVLGVEDEAAALIADVDGQVATVAEELPGLQGTTYALVNYVPGDKFYVVSDPKDGATVLFTQLGMEIAPAIVEAGDDASGRAEFSLEQASLFDSDLLMLLTNGGDPESITGYDSLTAVQSGAVLLLDYAGATAINTPSPLSVPYALEILRPALEKAAA